MKASIKFREDQKPLLRAKVPLNILGFPFQSGIEAGDAKELCLNLSTLFESGPLLKLSYRPNDSWRPFSLAVRTGIGHFGSPIGAPMTMCAEFNFIGNRSPSFFIHFRPRIGDFSIKRSVDSLIALPSQSQSSISTPKFRTDGDSENDEFFENNETPMKRGGGDRPVNGVFGGFPAVERVVAGVEVYGRTVLPVRDRAALKFRWRVRFPTDADAVVNRTAEFSFRDLPILVMSKVGIEHVAVDSNKQLQERKLNRIADVAEACLSVKKDVDVLQVESGLLRDGLDGLRSEICAGKYTPATRVKVSGNCSEIDQKNGGKRQNRENQFAAKVLDEKGTA